MRSDTPQRATTIEKYLQAVVSTDARKTTRGGNSRTLMSSHQSERGASVF